MKHRVFGKSNLGRKTSHRDSLFRTMVTQLIQHEGRAEWGWAGRARGLTSTKKGMQTTTVKMKRLRPIADKMVTLAKGGTLHHRRQALAYLKDKDVVRKLFAEFPARYLIPPSPTRLFLTLSRVGTPLVTVATRPS